MDYQLQLSTATHYGRHHHEFKLISNFFENKNLEILSFGCSTGEEAGLLKKLFPTSNVTGIDINTSALEKAQKNFPEIQYMHSSELKESNFF